MVIVQNSSNDETNYRCITSTQIDFSSYRKRKQLTKNYVKDLSWVFSIWHAVLSKNESMTNTNKHIIVENGSKI